MNLIRCRDGVFDWRRDGAVMVSFTGAVMVP